MLCVPKRYLSAISTEHEVETAARETYILIGEDLFHLVISQHEH